MTSSVACKIDLNSSNDESIDENSATLHENVDNDTENTESVLFGKYFKIVENKNNAKRNIAVNCLTCNERDGLPNIMRGSLLATSNFIRHLKVFYCTQM